MDKQRTHSSPQHIFLPTGIEGFDSLAELALNMRSSWNHAADEVWKELDSVLWELTHNPWLVLQTVAHDRLERLLTDPAFRGKVETLLKANREAIESPAWFQKNYSRSPLTSIAYFSMEFMLSEALPLYSGGLGNVAGDLLKTASDLGVPVFGVGLLYQRGYFRQVIDKEGAQEALFPYNDPGQLPIMPLREPNGEWLRLELEFLGYSLWLRTWQVQVGRVKLYLLDSNDPANSPINSCITSELYGGGQDLRLKQELVLGVGGWRLLKALGIEPEVCHLNEGHAAFVVLERAQSFMEKTGRSFEEALAVTRAGNLFTTHTPVAAGFDRFPSAMIGQYLGGYSEKKLGISENDLFALGRQNPNDASEDFNMAYLALRGSLSINGVSRLHGRVSRHVFQPLFKRWPEAEVPVGYVTNGVHMPTWDSAEADELWTESCGKARWLGVTEILTDQIRCIGDAQLWQFRTAVRKSLIEFVRRRLTSQLGVLGASLERIEEAKRIFDPNVLTLGFARRFAAYKRPTLLLHNPERLLRILINPKQPVQLIIAGKAHPSDRSGQALIEQWTHFIRRYEVGKHIVFLSDYDMMLTERLVQGVDVWLNTPRRPWEACGTSGMKALVNGSINLSELDGWWAEAYTPEVGWALGDGREHGDDPKWDNTEAESLYTLLEQHVIPEFYKRDANGIPTAWVMRMRESMARLTPHFSANRMVREYTEQYYIPLAATYLKRAADKGAAGAEIVNWRRTLEQYWSNLHFGEIKVQTEGELHRFEVQVYLNGLDLDSVRVDLYANGVNGSDPVQLEMKRGKPLVGTMNGYVYSAQAPVTRPASDYTPRVVPYRSDTAVPLEAAQILWML
jgi:starch phosphorylase